MDFICYLIQKLKWGAMGTAQILDSCFNGRLMLRQLTDLDFKMITSLLAGRYLCAWILKSVLNPAEEHSGPSQPSPMELSGMYLWMQWNGIVEAFELTLVLLVFSLLQGKMCASEKSGVPQRFGASDRARSASREIWLGLS